LDEQTSIRMSTSIILIRHGETDWNAEGRIQGHLPVPLNARGMAQAEALGDHLQTVPFDAVYSSDLLRTRQTAEAIVNRSGHEIRMDARLREWDLGMLSGLLRTQAERDHPRTAQIYRDYLVDEPIPGGESIRGRFERVTAAVSDIAAQHPGESVLVVSHGGPLGDCYRRAIGKGVEERVKPDLFNASINRIRVDGDDWSVDAWAQVGHLVESPSAYPDLTVRENLEIARRLLA
jgi:probable phosphoglycerate mutase